MRILFFVSSLNAGGAERVATTLANAWAQRGDDVILVPTFLTKHTSFYPVDDAVTLTWLADSPGYRLSRVLPGLGKWLQMRALIRKVQPDVVVSFLTNVNVNVLLASFGLRVPVIVSERTNPAHSRSAGRLLRFLRHLTYRRARAVVMQTHDGAELIKTLIPAIRHVAVVPNPLPPDLSDRLQENDQVVGLPGHPVHSHHVSAAHIVAMGRLVTTKQFEVLIDAFGQLAARHPDWSLAIWGEGPLRGELTLKINAMGLQNRVSLAGRTPDPWQVLSGADLFVMTSRVEGFPNVLLEAMALGLPCIALDCPSGPAELSRDGQDARLLPLNDPEALVSAMQELMQDAPARQRLGRQAAKSVRQRYGLPAILSQWDEVFVRAREH